MSHLCEMLQGGVRYHIASDITTSRYADVVLIAPAARVKPAACG